MVLGDVITAVNGDRVQSDLDLFRAIDKYAPGEKVGVTVARLKRLAGGRFAEEEAKLSIELQAVDAA